MPYGYRRYSRFRRPYATSGYRRRYSSVFRRRRTGRYSVARIGRAVSELRQQQELRIKDTYVTTTGISSAGYKVLLNGMTQGTGEGDRLSTKIVIKSVEVRMTVTNAASTDSYNQIRMMLVNDKQPNIGDYNNGDLLQDGLDSLLSTRNWFGRRRFKIYKDHTFTVDQDDPAKFVKFYKRMYLPVQYSNDTPGITAIVSNALWLQFYSDSDVAPHPGVELYIRIKYTA